MGLGIEVDYMWMAGIYFFIHSVLGDVDMQTMLR